MSSKAGPDPTSAPAATKPPTLTSRQIKAALRVGAINATEAARGLRGLEVRAEPPGLADALREQREANADACGTAACWQGEFMCEQARTAGTKEVTAVHSPAAWALHLAAKGVGL